MSGPLLVLCSSDQNQSDIALEMVRTTWGWSGSSSEHPDLHWFGNQESGLKIEDVRLIGEQVSYQPVGETTYLLLPHLEKASLPAQQALLKMLEEPPEYVRWVLVTTNLKNILPTIQSRSTIISKARSVENLTPEIETEIAALYEKIRKSTIAELIVLSDTYSDRDEAINILGQLVTYLHKLPATKTTVQHLKALLQTQQWLTMNINVKLAMGECFFELKRLG